MHLIIGLGNPGKKYIDTRHNAGFLFLEHLRNAWEFPPFQKKPAFFSEYSEAKKDNEHIILVQPCTFMNDSGAAVQAISHFYKVETRNITVVHDDIDIPLGEIRESFGSRSAGHNGVEDIIRKLGTKDFFRVRIGIKSDSEGSMVRQPINAATFVLEPFTPTERTLLESLFPKIVAKLLSWVHQEDTSPPQNS